QSGCTIVSFVATLIRGADVAARHPYLAGVQDAPLFTLPRKRATHRKHKRPRPLVALLRTPWWASPSHREALRKPLPDGADSCHVAEVISCMSQIPDPFLESRKKDAVLKCTFQGESLPMILRHRDVREACKDWKTFSSEFPFPRRRKFGPCGSCRSRPIRRSIRSIGRSWSRSFNEPNCPR